MTEGRRDLRETAEASPSPTFLQFREGPEPAAGQANSASRQRASDSSARVTAPDARLPGS